MSDRIKASSPAVSDPAGQASLALSTKTAVALAAFRRDLPQLLLERRGQWVAYEGERVIGFATTKTELYQRCAREGYTAFLVRHVERYPDEEFLGPFEPR
jgi:hypothetical protein